MKILFRYKIKAILFCLMTWTWVSCDQNREVAPIDPPDDHPVATITPVGSIPSTVNEGDTLMFTITLDAMVDQAIDWGAVIMENSGADSEDIAVIGGTIFPFQLEGSVGLVILSDGIAETGEQLILSLDASEDIGYNFQINPTSDSESVNVKVNNYDLNLDWSAGTYDGEDLCEASVDLDVYIANADFSASNFGGATGACPLEGLSFQNMPDDEYDIYVDFWSSGIPTGEDVEIPWTVVVSNNGGEPYTFDGTFNNIDAGAITAIVGSITVDNGTYTLKDADGVVLGQI